VKAVYCRLVMATTNKKRVAVETTTINNDNNDDDDDPLLSSLCADITGGGTRSVRGADISRGCSK